MYNQMEYCSPRPYFHTFSADVSTGVKAGSVVKGLSRVAAKCSLPHLSRAHLLFMT